MSTAGGGCHWNLAWVLTRIKLSNNSMQRTALRATADAKRYAFLATPHETDDSTSHISSG